ncbi:MAG TPA: protein translocase subunit SecD [Gemmatimonadales bacterium]|nr:protein translocase subunit SecD [Gemmatimonadales bacterium]
MSIRTRLLLIAGLIALSIFYLVPRNVTLRERDTESGVMTDRTEKRVPLKLGLDLQGGMHLALELDQSRQVSADPKRDLQLALTVLRKRIDEFGVTEPLIQQVGSDRIVVELAGIKDPARAKAIVQRSAFLEFKITDETRALEKALPAMDRTLRNLGIKAEGTPTQPSAVQQLLGGDSAKAAANDSTAVGKDTARAKDTAATKDSAATADTGAVVGGVLSGLIQPSSATGAGGTPGEYVVPETAFPRVDSLLNIPAVARQLPRGIVLRWSSTPTSVGVEPVRFLYALNEKSIITGSNLVDAQAQLDPLTNGPIVTFELDRRGGRTFGEETGRHVGDYMAILLDGRVQGRPPVIQSRIGRNGQITLAGRTLQEAQDLALTLKAGALPIPLKIVEERQVGPTLGEDAVRSGIIAGIIGTLFVIAVMVLYYRTAGVLAVVALGLYVLLTLGALAMLDATLTLPGLAGLVLSIGIAVDANVLIFERIREELAAGKTVSLSIDEGFKHAMSAIVDSNVTTVLTGLFLFQFGTGPVKGFAVTLILGIIASMISAIFVTRTLFILWLNRKPAMATLSI